MYPACQEPSQPESRPVSFYVFILAITGHFLLIFISSLALAINVTHRQPPNQSKSFDGPCAIDVSILLLSFSYFAFAIVGSLTRNRSQIYACSASLISSSILVILYYFSPPQFANPVYNVIRGVTGFFGSIIIVILTVWTSKDFHETKIVGAGDSLRLMYQQRKRFLTALLLDFIFIFVLALMAITLDKGIWCSLAIFAFASIRWFVGRIAVLHESKPLIHIFVSIQMLGQLWIPLQILLSTCILKCVGEPVSPFAMLTSAIASLLASLMTHIQLLKVHRNFGYGLTDPGECQIFIFISIYY